MKPGDNVRVTKASSEVEGIIIRPAHSGTESVWIIKTAAGKEVIAIENHLELVE